jgi:hypothetical protein
MYESKLLKQTAQKKLSEVKMNKNGQWNTAGKQGTAMTDQKNYLNRSGL